MLSPMIIRGGKGSKPTITLNTEVSQNDEADSPDLLNNSKRNIRKKNVNQLRPVPRAKMARR